MIRSTLRNIQNIGIIVSIAYISVLFLSAYRQPEQTSSSFDSTDIPDSVVQDITVTSTSSTVISTTMPMPTRTYTPTSTSTSVPTVDVTEIAQQVFATQTAFALTSSVTRIEYGQSITGQVQTEEGDTWAFNGSAGDIVTISLENTGDLDPFLDLNDSRGRTLVSDDDSGNNLNSLIANYTLPRDDIYTIVARGYNGDTGTYSLRLTLVNEGDLTYGTRVTDRVTSSSGDQWTFFGQQNDEVSIYLYATSSNFDTYLELLDSDGESIQENDDGGSGFNSELSVRLPATGLYTIVARGFNGDTGPYQLWLNPGYYVSSVSYSGTCNSFDWVIDVFDRNDLARQVQMIGRRDNQIPELDINGDGVYRWSNRSCDGESCTDVFQVVDRSGEPSPPFEATIDCQ